jgi:hypothetical protein
MSVLDAKTSQEMATRHKRSVPVVIDGLRTVNVLLAKMIDTNKIKWDGFGTNFEWYVRKSDESATWSAGQLGTRTFEEIDPIDKAYLPYCYVEKTYGISEKSIMSNRAGGEMKLYDIQKENARAAQTALYEAFSAAIYSNGTNSLQPVGLAGMVGNAYSGSDINASDTPNVAANTNYANIALTGSTAVSAWSSVYSTMNWSKWYWYPIVIPPVSIYATSPAWSAHPDRYLAWMEVQMTYSSDVSGTGGIIKPDMALMSNDPYNALVSILLTSQRTYNVPLGSKAAYLADFPNIRVGSIDCVRDDNVPVDSRSAERVFVVDSNQLWLETYHTKSEGLIRSDFDATDPNVRGAVGVYKSWLGMAIQTPKAIGCIVGCDD